MPAYRHWITVLCVCAAGIALTGCRVASNGQNSLGVSLFQQGRVTEALQQFQLAVAKDPSNADAYYNLARTYHHLGVGQKDQRLVEQAESLYNQCLDLSPNHVECHRGLAVLLAESGRPDAAMRLLQNWAARNPGMSAPRIELARLYQEFGQPQLAERYLDEALALNPNDHRAWAAKGYMREAAGQLTQALQNYQQSLAINSLQPELYQRVAALNMRIAQGGNGTEDSTWTVQNQQIGGVRRY